MEVELCRFRQYPDAWIGRLMLPIGKMFFTLEPPERTQKPHCVARGTYQLIPYDSPKHGYTWCLHNPKLNVYAGMPGYREPNNPEAMNYVEIHVGNFPHDSLGCILLGDSWNKEDKVWDSGKAVKEFLKAMTPMSEGHTLTISERVD